MTPLTLADTAIRQDAHGRHNLSDLHQSSGGANKHRPSLWLRHKGTAETIEILNLEARNRASNFAPVNTVKGHGITATYVVMELVYDYAMWVSPAFKIKVIRAFHALQTRPRVQHEKALTSRHPFYPTLRELVLEGKKDVEIAPLIERSPGSAGYHRKKQFNEGFTDPIEYAHKRYSAVTAQKVIAKQGWDTWGSTYETAQAGFNFEFAATAA